MPRGELYINNCDAYTTWGISLEDEAISALMTPAPLKGFVESKSRRTHGKRVITSNAKKDERDVSLSIHLCAASRSQFFARYAAFCDELAKGSLALWTEHQPDVEYHCVYASCSQFSAYIDGLAVYTLRLTEPNPADRTVTVNKAAISTDSNNASTSTEGKEATTE